MMQLREDVNIREFFKGVRQCRGEVLLKTQEGDILNLKSALSQFVFAVILENREKLEGIEVTLEDEGDRESLKMFLDLEAEQEEEDGKI